MGGRTPLRERVESRLRELTDVDDVGETRRGGDFEYFDMRRKGEELAKIYRRPAADGKSDRPSRVDPALDYEVVVDPVPMSATLTTQVEILAVERDGRRLLYSVRDGGQDEVEIRVRDLAAGTDLPERLPPALYSSLSFDSGGSGFYYSRRSRQTGARIFFHRWGTDVTSDEMLFGEGYGPKTLVSMTQAADGRYRIFTAQHGWARTEVFLQDLRGRGGPRPIVTHADARLYPPWGDG